ncbi:Phosphoglycerate mutase-like protein [Mycena chlorophos]|uniref:Phosphoglycerate mutase-like protein n=1 Tax=Mycena chlorophos TaxID=658473 RepID=A0A8H6TNR3_MYCCL|nr:Phosphoglycerate mutase-like protein [Mycena chlorophos]
MSPFARVYIVRHGETRENREAIIQGQLDTELNELGLLQAKQVARTLKAVVFDAAYTSDLKRAVKTAEIILEEQPTSEVELRKEEALRERFMGTLEGTKWLDTQSHNAKVAADSTIENTVAFSARTSGWWKRAILQRTLSLPPREEPYNVLVVSHGGAIGTLVRGLIGTERAVLAAGVQISSLKNVSITLLEVEKEKKPALVVKYGDVSHLEGDLESVLVRGNVDEVKQ